MSTGILRRLVSLLLLPLLLIWQLEACTFVPRFADIRMYQIPELSCDSSDLLSRTQKIKSALDATSSHDLMFASFVIRVIQWQDMINLAPDTLCSVSWQQIKLRQVCVTLT